MCYYAYVYLRISSTAPGRMTTFTALIRTEQMSFGFSLLARMALASVSLIPAVKVVTVTGPAASSHALRLKVVRTLHQPLAPQEAGPPSDGTPALQTSAVAFAANGGMLAIAGYRRSSNSRRVTTTICVWKVATGRLIRRIQPNGMDCIWRLALSNNGNLVAAGSSTGAQLWSTSDARLLDRINGRCAALSFVGNHKLLALGSDGTLSTWLDGRRHTLKLRSARLDWGEFLEDGRHVVGLRELRRDPEHHNLADWAVGTLDIRRGRSGRFRQVLEDVRLEAYAAARRTGRMALFEWYDGNTIVVDPPRWRTRSTLSLHNWAQGIALSPDGRMLAAGRKGGTVRIVDTLTGRQVTSTQLPCTDVAAVCWSGDGKLIAAIGENNEGPTITQVWRILR